MYNGVSSSWNRPARVLPRQVPAGIGTPIDLACQRGLLRPFTELEGPGGPAELEERARGTGARRAVGELLTCPYCLSLWVVSIFSIGLLFAPRLTRFFAAVLSALTISDFLQIAYKAAEEKGLG